jgi:hypothetical protein
MRYRLEILSDDQIVICNVETDLVLGFASYEYGPSPDGTSKRAYLGVAVLDTDRKEFDFIPHGDFFPSKEWLKTDPLAKLVKQNMVPLKDAAQRVADHEERLGYPGLKAGLGTAEPKPDRIERRLGEVLADLAVETIQGGLQCGNGGLSAATKEKCVSLLCEAYRIWYASRFGSYDAERRVFEPYFLGYAHNLPRLEFADAARLHGMTELRVRFLVADHAVDDAVLRDAISLPLELLERLITRLAPPPSKAFMASLQKCWDAISTGQPTTH